MSVFEILERGNVTETWHVEWNGGVPLTDEEAAYVGVNDTYVWVVVVVVIDTTFGQPQQIKSSRTNKHE